ncbi:hypothetical protein C2G38_2216623 [Gigaspora rosea]|uniref:F-box domain-containing protein n=1 Tax=Gigaspora rosea TaxID=44941 RepID=A0A397U8I5_9GLOM|nr:hypothetical protein C2G38_2216623 [Gigaspora rosea]
MNYFNIIPVEIFFMIIDSLYFDSGWELKSFALVCKDFYNIIKSKTECTTISAIKDLDFDTLFELREQPYIKEILNHIQYSVLFCQFKTTHITIKKFEYNHEEKFKYKKYITPKNLLSKIDNFYFFYETGKDYVIDIRILLFYKKNELPLDKEIKNFWCFDNGEHIIRNNKKFCFSKKYFDYLRKDGFIKSI